LGPGRLPEDRNRRDTTPDLRRSPSFGG
jgi:hypothetical protein